MYLKACVVPSYCCMAVTPGMIPFKNQSVSKGRRAERMEERNFFSKKRKIIKKMNYHKISPLCHSLLTLSCRHSRVLHVIL